MGHEVKSSLFVPQSFLFILLHSASASPGQTFLNMSDSSCQLFPPVTSAYSVSSTTDSTIQDMVWLTVIRQST
ncbi:uncharacterized protein B0T23DRAFT_388297 [Neurospora hispaniola]|uniref:Uncharacterized protein n=1 Tax=Neurospora hispaniola TaxID=588809 RepID=A0AAJ0MN19_9PEZI|nr:hypothetical protein B0T23DRAFT_388297 [Neurospora hispaniola]